MNPITWPRPLNRNPVAAVLMDAAMPIIREAQRAGATTLRDVAEALNARGVLTARGGTWHATTVKNILARNCESLSRRFGKLKRRQRAARACPVESV